MKMGRMSSTGKRTILDIHEHLLRYASPGTATLVIAAQVPTPAKHIVDLPLGMIDNPVLFLTKRPSDDSSAICLGRFAVRGDFPRTFGCREAEYLRFLTYSGTLVLTNTLSRMAW